MDGIVEDDTGKAKDDSAARTIGHGTPGTRTHPELTPLQAATKRCLERERERLKAITTSPPVIGSPARQLLDTAVASAELTLKPSIDPKPLESVVESLERSGAMGSIGWAAQQPAGSSNTRGNRHAARAPAPAPADIMDMLPPLGAMGSLVTTSFSMTSSGHQQLGIQGEHVGSGAARQSTHARGCQPAVKQILPSVRDKVKHRSETGYARANLAKAGTVNA